MNTFTAIYLTVVIITGDGKQDIVRREPMFDMWTCLAKAAEFEFHKFPDHVGAKRQVVSCDGALAEERPS